MKRIATLTVPSLFAGAAMLSIASLAGSSAFANEAGSEQAAEQESAAVQTSPSDEPLPDEIDWTALAVPLDRPYAPAPKLRTSAPRDPAPAWSRNDRPNGTAAVSLKQPLSPFWDMKAGVDLDVATQPSPLRTPETLPERLASDSRVETSQGAAWLTAKAPGVPYLADHVALEARMNPTRDARLGTGFSKSLPLGDEVSLTLRHGYYVTQHDAIPGLPATAAHARSLDMDRSAEVSFTDTGTSFVAGQARSASGDRWLNSVGAQQKLFDGLSITGSVSETPQGFSNKSLTAGFKKSW
jgi:hypothetical protein